MWHRQDGSIATVVDRAAIEALIATYCDAWQVRDRDAWLATFDEHATQEDPVGEGIRVGQEEIGQFWDRAQASYDEVELRPRALRIAGSEAALEWTIVAKEGDEWVVFDGVDVFTFDSRPSILTVRAYWDRDRRERTARRP